MKVGADIGVLLHGLYAAHEGSEAFGVLSLNSVLVLYFVLILNSIVNFFGVSLLVSIKNLPKELRV